MPMSDNQTLKRFLALALIFNGLQDISGLSAIQIPNANEEAAIKSPEANEKSLRSAIESLKGKVVQNDPEFNPAVEQMQYDSLDDIQYIDENASQQPIVRGKKNIKQWDHWVRKKISIAKSKNHLNNPSALKARQIYFIVSLKDCNQFQYD